MASKLKQSLKPSNFENINNFVNSKKTDGIFDIPQIEYSFVTFFSSMNGTKPTGLDCIVLRLFKIAPKARMF